MEDNDRMLDAMYACGGSFVRQLARTITNTDNGAYFLEELAKCLHRADEANQHKIGALLEDAHWLVFWATQNDRLTRMRETWPDEWANYSEMAKVSAAGPRT